VTITVHSTSPDTDPCPRCGQIWGTPAFAITPEHNDPSFLLKIADESARAALAAAQDAGPNPVMQHISKKMLEDAATALDAANAEIARLRARPTEELLARTLAYESAQRGESFPWGKLSQEQQDLLRADARAVLAKFPKAQP
jgi:hypothetical protein